MLHPFKTLQVLWYHLCKGAITVLLVFYQQFISEQWSSWGTALEGRFARMSPGLEEFLEPSVPQALKTKVPLLLLQFSSFPSPIFCLARHKAGAYLTLVNLVLFPPEPLVCPCPLGLRVSSAWRHSLPGSTVWLPHTDLLCVPSLTSVFWAGQKSAVFVGTSFSSLQWSINLLDFFPDPELSFPRGKFLI